MLSTKIALRLKLFCVVVRMCFVNLFDTNRYYILYELDAVLMSENYAL